MKIRLGTCCASSFWAIFCLFCSSLVWGDEETGANQPIPSGKEKPSAQQPVEKEAKAAQISTQMQIMPVAEVREGMEGVGRSVFQGTKIEEFKVQIIGVQKNVAPGRDLVLARLSGANLEQTGVIAGMSGSPVYINGKLLGAVAYAWAFSKQPIAGITPFEQMRSQSSARVPTAVAKISATAAGTMPPSALDLSANPWDILTLNQPQPSAKADASVWGTLATAGASQMEPISIPVSASGFGPQSLSLLGRLLKPQGMLPVAAGEASAEVAQQPAPIVPGAALACGLITGDMDLTGIGTVTHVEDRQVWGWGHPFMRRGQCEYLLRGGYIHVVNPNLQISTKMGSPLSVEGVIRADVGSCVAGELGAKADLLPLFVTVKDAATNTQREYRVQIVRQDELIGPLVGTVLNNSIEELGSLPAELTVEISATIKAADLEPISIKDVYSGSSVSGSDGVSRLFGQLAVIANGLTRNPFAAARIDSIECHTVIRADRQSASIERVRLESDVLKPGETLRAVVTMRPHKQQPVDVSVELALPSNLPAGQYQALVCDTSTHLRNRFSEEPQLLTARDVAGIAQSFRNQLEERRHTLFLRVALPSDGLALAEVALPQLPASALAVFNSSRTYKPTPLRRSLVSRHTTPWATEGSTSLNFTIKAP